MVQGPKLGLGLVWISFDSFFFSYLNRKFDMVEKREGKRRETNKETNQNEKYTKPYYD